MTKKYHYVQYEHTVIMTAKVLAESEEEAIALVTDGEYEDKWEEDSRDFRVVDVSTRD